MLQWAEVGRTTVMFALESYKWSHTYIDNCWYASTTADWQWFTPQHIEPIVLRTYSGRTEKLQAAVSAIYTGKEVVVPCMVDGNMQDLALRKAQHRHRHVVAGFGENPGHPDLLCDHSGAHRRFPKLLRLRA